MKSSLLLILFILLFFNRLYSQNTLFDNTRVSSVYIEINPDSLEVIMTDVLSDHYFSARFIYDYGTTRDTVNNVGFRLRGNTSRYAQKKSFKISLNTYVSGRRYQGVKKINLNGQHNDPTMIREKLFYDSWKKAGMVERRTSFVKLYINQAYYGLYTNLEEFDKDWLQRVYGENDGNLYKCTYPADLVYLNTNQQTYKDIQSSSATGGRAYDLQTNETEDDYRDLVDLIVVLNHKVDTAFARLVEEKINVDSFLKAFAIDVASGNWDDYMYNKNNYFLYHRADTDKFEFISYDTDNTFGVDWVNRDWATRNCLDWYTHNEPRPLASKILSVPAFMDKYQRYLDTIAREIINPAGIFSHIDSLKSLITEAAIADTYRTLDYGYTVSDFHDGFIATIDIHTPYGIKPFLTKRYTTMLQQLATYSVPEISFAGSTPFLFPNPAGELLTVKILPLKNDRLVSIYDLYGRMLKSFILLRKQSELTVPVDDLKPGVYILVTEHDGRTISSRFIKK
jgi:spore coat protein CotH